MDLFNLNTTLEETAQKMSIDEFVKKTRDILKKIDSEYGAAHQWRIVEDDEYEQQDCENCKGDCIMKINGKELQSEQDKEKGECCVLEINDESFFEELSNIMYHDEKYSFYELLSCDITNENKTT